MFAIRMMTVCSLRGQYYDSTQFCKSSRIVFYWQYKTEPGLIVKRNFTQYFVYKAYSNYFEIYRTFPVHIQKDINEICTIDSST